MERLSASLSASCSTSASTRTLVPPPRRHASVGRPCSHSCSRPTFQQHVSPANRLSVACSAKRTAIGGYTPADYITYSEEPQHQCEHTLTVLVDAPASTCYQMFSNWARIVDFVDLIGQVGLDEQQPEMALFQCYYRWEMLPVMEICFLLKKTEEVENETIVFDSAWGMPMSGSVRFTPHQQGKTLVRMHLRHPVPHLLVQLNIGAFGVETQLGAVLQENMEEMRRLAEAEAPGDWPQQREKLAAQWEASRQAQQAAEQEQAAKQQQAAKQTLAQQRGDEASGSGATAAGKQQAAAAPSAGRKRTSSSKAGATAGDAAPSAPPAASRKSPSRGRRSTAAAAADQPGPAPPAPGRKTSRGRTSRAEAQGNGAAPGGDAAANQASRRGRSKAQ